MSKKLKQISINANAFASTLTGIANGYFARVNIEIGGISVPHAIEVPEKAFKLAAMFNVMKN